MNERDHGLKEMNEIEYGLKEMNEMAGIYPSKFDVWYTAQKTQSSNRVFKLNLHKISF